MKGVMKGVIKPEGKEGKKIKEGRKELCGKKRRGQEHISLICAVHPEVLKDESRSPSPVQYILSF